MRIEVGAAATERTREGAIESEAVEVEIEPQAGIKALREDDGAGVGAGKAAAARTAQIEARHGADKDAAHDCAGRRVIRGTDEEWLGLAVVQKADPDGRMVGIVVCRCATFANRTMEVGWRLEGGFWGEGLATEAARGLVGWLVREVGVRKVVALCAEGNVGSWRVMEKMGMRLEERLREYSWLGGEWVDERVYGVLGREWRG